MKLVINPVFVIIATMFTLRARVIRTVQIMPSGVLLLGL